MEYSDFDVLKFSWKRINAVYGLLRSFLGRKLYGLEFAPDRVFIDERRLGNCTTEFENRKEPLNGFINYYKEL